MANITSNSGTTFVSAGGTVGVDVSTNTNWRFYLIDENGEPDWLHFNGNVSEITGSESQTVMVEAMKNSQGARTASGICESTNEAGLMDWTLFLQYAGSGGDDDGLKLNLILKVWTAMDGLEISRIVLTRGAGSEETMIFEWRATWYYIPVERTIDAQHNLIVTTIALENLKSGYTEYNIQKSDLQKEKYFMNFIGGADVKVDAETNRYSVGIGYSQGHQYDAGGNGITVEDEGDGSYTINTTDLVGGYWQLM